MEKAQKMFTCEICRKEFRKKSNMTQHLLLHDKNRVLPKCEKCGKEFSSKRNLNAHLEIHKQKKGKDKL